jgi:hypothetical protein
MQDLPHKLVDFMHAASLDLKMWVTVVQNSIQMRKNVALLSRNGMSVLRPRMGVSSSANIFQEQMTELMMEDVSPVSETSFSDHLFKQDEVLRRVQLAGLKINAKNPSLQRRTRTPSKVFCQCQRKQMQ